MIINRGRNDILERLQRFGFQVPNPFQAATIPLILKGESFMAQSSFRTGKTVAFQLGCIASVDTSIDYPQVIILTSTRELVL